MKAIRLTFTLITFLVSCFPSAKETTRPDVDPPVALKKPFEIVAKHGHTRIDNYYWLNNREDENVIRYLDAENQYLDTMMAHTRGLQEKLFTEMRSRIKEQDESVPYKLDDYYYYTRFIEGGEYPIYCRKKGSLEAPEEIITNGNELGENQAFLNFYVSTSPDHRLACIVMDTIGRNFYTIKVKDLATGTFLADKIPDTRGSVQWTNDNASFFYAVPDKTTLRSHLVRRHTLATPPSNDPVVYEEKDETLSCYLGKTKSKKYITISSGRTDASSVRLVDAYKPGKPVLVQPLENDVEYYVNHTGGNTLFIYTNLNATNYRLVETPASKPSKENWKDVVPHRDDVLLNDVEYFSDFMVLEEISEGLVRIRIRKSQDNTEFQVDFPEAAYHANLTDNHELNSIMLRYTYTSPTTPPSTYDYNMVTRASTLLKEQEVPGGFDKTNYQAERVLAKARDGASVPLTIVYRKETFKKDGTSPCLQYGYGSYGYSMFPNFNSNVISLLDRGFVYAIAHIRGGQEMGGKWYDDGKMMKKKNTFTDFIDCSEYLIREKYTSQDKLFASGRSAGGLLMGAVTNMRPDLYKGIIAGVPFVDVVTTMMDESIPLTTFEWREWGNPNIKEEYEYILSYSPYDNVEQKAYPNILVTTGLHDSQVQYFEPAKWVAKLRELKTDDNLVLFYTNMEAGHGGASGRFRRLKETAMEYAFMLDIAGLSE